LNNTSGETKRHNRILPLVVLAALAFVVFGDLVFGGATLYLRDITSYHLPYFRFVQEQIGSGSLPSWNPYTEFGEPVAALGFPSAFYPAQFLMMLSPDFLWGFNVLIVLHIALAGCFMYWCARTLGCSRRGSFIAGAAWALGPEIISMILVPNTFFGATWMPAAVAAYVSVIKSGSPSSPAAVRRGILSFLALVFSIGMMLLAGGFQVAALSIIIMFCLGAIRIVKPAAIEAGPPGRARAALCAGSALVIAVGIGALLAAAQVFPIWEFFSQSLRSAGYESQGYSYGTRYAFQWIRLPETLFPALFGPVMPSNTYGMTLLNPESSMPVPYFCTIYLGIGALMLAVIGSIKRRSPLTWFLIAVGGIGILAGLGNNFPPLSWLIAHMPFLRSFRYAEKWFCLTAFAVPILAGFGFDALAAHSGKWKESAPRYLKTVFISLSLGLLVSVILIVLHASGIRNIWMYRIALSAAHVLGVMTLLAGIMVRGAGRTFTSARYVAIVLALLAADFAFAARYQTFTMPRERYDYKAALADRIRETTGTAGIKGWTFMRVPFPETMPPVDDGKGRVLGMGEQFVWTVSRQMGGSAPLVGKFPTLQRNLIMTPAPIAKMLEHWSRNPQFSKKLLDRYGVRYFLEKSPPPAFSRIHGLKPVADFPVAGQSLWENPDALPYAYLSRIWYPVKGYENSIEHMLLERDLPIDTAIVAYREGQPPIEWSAPEMPGGKVEIVEFGYDRFVYDVDANYKTYFVENAVNYPGWRARVDGKEAPVETVNAFCRAVKVAQGKHRIEMYFRSESLHAGVWTSVISLVFLALAAAAVAALSVLKRREKPGTQA
jgi:hypothetical protein